MIMMRFPVARALIVLSMVVVVPSVKLQGAQSLDDLKGKRAMDQKNLGQALTHFLAAHAQDRTNSERYRLIAYCLQNTNHPLPAMAWYQAYLAAPGADPQHAQVARNQVGLLETDVRSKMDLLFKEAMNVGEKLVQEKASLTGVKMKMTRHLFSLPELQADSGMLEEALMRRKRIDAMGVVPEFASYNWVSERSLRHRYGMARLSLRDRFIWVAVVTGDAATVQGELKKASTEAIRDWESKENAKYKLDNGFTRYEEWGYLAELIRFNLNQESNYRLTWAEQITNKDPMENLDANSVRIMGQKDVEGIPEALSSLAVNIGQSYWRVRAMRPENSKPELSRDAHRFAMENVSELCTGRRMVSFIPEYDRLLVRAVSRFDIYDANTIGDDGNRWPLVAWALKRKGRLGYDKIIRLLTENGMGVNDPASTKYDENSVGNRPLHWAAQWNNLAAVEVLIANKALPRIKNARGLTPLDLALAPNKNVGNYVQIRNEIIQRLRQAMQDGPSK